MNAKWWPLDFIYKYGYGMRQKTKALSICVDSSLADSLNRLVPHL